MRMGWACTAASQPEPVNEGARPRREPSWRLSRALSERLTRSKSSRLSWPRFWGDDSTTDSKNAPEDSFRCLRRASAEAVLPRGKRSDIESTYSQATVVDVSTYAHAHVARARAMEKPLSERLIDAVADALDYKLSRCGLARDLRPALAAHLCERELFVTDWALCAAASRSAANAAREAAAAARYGATPACANSSNWDASSTCTPSEATVRAVAAGVYNTMADLPDVAMTAAMRAIPVGWRRLRVPLSFALALLAAVCTFARLQMTVSVRRGANRGRAAFIARGSRAALRVDILGSLPALIVVRRAPLDAVIARSRAAREEGDDAIADVAELIDDFASAIVLKQLKD